MQSIMPKTKIQYMKRSAFGVLAGVAVAVMTSCGQASTSYVADGRFVSIEDGHFVCDDQPYYYVGANFWYGAILASEGQGGNRARLAVELDSLESIGVDNLRILVGADGENGLPSRVQPTLQTEPGVYNDTILDGLDYLLAEMGKRNMKAVLYLNNSWEWSGGYSVYLQWAGKGRAPIPSVDGWPVYMDYVKMFMKCDEAKEMFANHVRFIIGRTNRYTNVAYADDPTIMTWQIGNEPRCFADDNKDAFVEWMQNCTALIKSLDKNHLVSSGNEGLQGCEGDINLFEDIHSDPNMDYMNIHIWPLNWTWVNKDNLSDKLDVAKTNTLQYIEQHLAIAEKHGKPLVIEEFGYPRDGYAFSRESTTTARDSYYDFVFEQVINQAAQKGNLAGCNFWAWGGSAVPSSEHVFWCAGDDYTGDPAQEEQGLNSVFASDSTMAVIRDANAKIIAITR